MDGTTVQTITLALDELASRFGATGARLWEQMVAYQITAAIMDAILFPVLAAAFSLLAMWCIRRGDQEPLEVKYYGSVLAGLAALITGGASLCSWVILVRTLVAPEAATLFHLLGKAP